VAKRKKKVRQSSITPALRRQILKYYGMGGSTAEIERATGTSRRSIGRLAKKDKAFRMAIFQAKAMGKLAVVECFHAAATTDWKAAQKYLASTDPDKWSEKRNGTKTHIHAHAHAAMPPAVVFEIIDKRLPNGTDQTTSPPSPSGFLE
jgi:hypothetical protein